MTWHVWVSVPPDILGSLTGSGRVWFLQAQACMGASVCELFISQCEPVHVVSSGARWEVAELMEQPVCIVLYVYYMQVLRKELWRIFVLVMLCHASDFGS
jgi:hypothetical protein